MQTCAAPFAYFATRSVMPQLPRKLPLHASAQNWTGGLPSRYCTGKKCLHVNQAVSKVPEAT